MRILVTGSRDWDDREEIVHALLDTRDNQSRAGKRMTVMTLVEGACPTGADAIAHEYAIKWGWDTERHPADWDTHGKKAGFVRNKTMVDAGANICLAFIKNDSRGATMCAQLARDAGIPVKEYRA
jgi:hypothetical protein